MNTRAFYLAGVATAFACGGGGTASPTPVPATTSTPASGAGFWSVEGTRLTNADVGFSGVLADTTTLQLTDGRWRMFLFAGNQYRSAISADGLSFTMEPGTRLPEGDGHARVLRLSDGRARIYFITRGGISSAISSDEGLTFTDEPGERVSAGMFGASQLSGCSIVRAGSGWRMYFSDLPIPGAGTGVLRIFSASSPDLLSWFPDPGVRIGAGAALSGSGEHPAAIVESGGAVSLYYFRNSTLTFMVASSADGLAFTSEAAVGISQANDPDIVALPGGGLRMYYNWGNNTGGSIFSARRP
jgi:hypothetical protein